MSTKAEIERIVGNRRAEVHPFKSNSAGMEWFSRMIPLVDELTRKEVDEFLLPLLDELVEGLKSCESCRAKLLVFAELYASRKAPLKAADYWRQYQHLVANRREDATSRDFRAEVYEAIDRYGVRGGRE